MKIDFDFFCCFLVFSAALEKNFAEFSVEIVDSPDFQKPPFTLAASGNIIVLF